VPVGVASAGSSGRLRLRDADQLLDEMLLGLSLRPVPRISETRYKQVRGVRNVSGESGRPRFCLRPVRTPPCGSTRAPSAKALATRRTRTCLPRPRRDQSSRLAANPGGLPAREATRASAWAGKTRACCFQTESSSGRSFDKRRQGDLSCYCP